MGYDIITIGSGTIDYFADSDSEIIRIDTRTTREELIAFPLGGKILINELNTTTGGGGTNTAVSFSRLGLKTAWLGKLGDDPAADFILDKMREEHVDFIGKRAGNSGISFVLNSIRDDRTILAYKGANDELLPEDVPTIDAPWLYVASMLKQSWDTVVELVRRGNFKVAFNPSSYQASMGHQVLRPMVEKVAILIMNRDEACKFLGRPDTKDIDMVQLVREMAQVPGQTTAITDGANGVWVCHEGTVHAGKPLEGLQIQETTGAGDAFASTFTCAIIRGLPADQALDHAMTNAESVLQHKGAKEQLLGWDSLTAKVQSQARHIESWPA